MDTILSVTFVIAVVAFFKAQLNLANDHALLAAFGVALVVGLAPQAAITFPILQPWVEAVLNVVVVFLSAAGSYDFAVGLMKKREEISAR